MYIDVYFEKDEKEPERIVINGKHCYHVKGMADVHNLFIHLFGGYTDIPYNFSLMGYSLIHVKFMTFLTQNISSHTKRPHN